MSPQPLQLVRRAALQSLLNPMLRWRFLQIQCLLKPDPNEMRKLINKIALKQMSLANGMVPPLSWTHLCINRVAETKNGCESEQSNEFVRILFEFVVDRWWVEDGSNKATFGSNIAGVDDTGEHLFRANVTRLNDFRAREQNMTAMLTRIKD